MSPAVVRNLGAPRGLPSEQDVDDFEQELVDQYALAMAAVGLSDGHIAASRSAVVEFARSLPGGRLWTASVNDSDRFLTGLRRRGQAKSTVAGKAGGISRFYDFLISRYQGDIHRLTGYVVQQPIDEFNRPSDPSYGTPRVPPADQEVEELFARWGAAVPEARKYLPAARDYFAASLWRRLGLRIGETVMLDIRDWRPDLGEFGKLNIRFGKGSRGRGHKPRLIPAINEADSLIDWWLAEVRPRYGPDWENPEAPMLPSERRDLDGTCLRVGAESLRTGLANATTRWLPAWADGRLTPHVLRHYCASSLYQRGVDLKAVQEVLGHEWLSTTTRYVHVRSDHIEQAWTDANERVAARLSLEGR